ncbi:Hypothetical_protein [Hexamita inflata]|uniref:Hypothetical_protein n=1 Tax=Hexamita inflata TaxID=28002 RepID=A0AA86TW03_9EUKA|nr:Hypothetical protein HINF_LOCUS18750 [Hexamita inflata]
MSMEELIQEETEQFKRVALLYRQELRSLLIADESLAVPSEAFLDICLYLQILSPNTANLVFKLQGVPTLAQVEKHKRAMIDGECVQKLAIGYGVPIQEVIDGSISQYIKLFCPNSPRHSLVLTCGQDALYFVPRVERVGPIGSYRYNGVMPAYQGQPEADLKPLVIGYTFILNVLNKNVNKHDYQNVQTLEQYNNDEFSQM